MEKVDIMDKVINKGVPVSTPIGIRYCDLLELCDDKEKFDQIIDKNFKKYVAYLYSTIENMKDLKIFKTLSLKTDPTTLRKSFVFSRDGFISTLLFNLNYNNICNGSETSEDVSFNLHELYDRVSELRQVNDERKLKKEFPVLYEYYLKEKELYRKIIEFERKVDNSKRSQLEKMKLKYAFHKQLEQRKVKFEGSIFELARKFDVRSFCNSYAKLFDELVTKYEEICEYIENQPFQINDISIDPEKIELYIAYRHLQSLCSEVVSDKQRFVYYLAQYYKENPKRKHDSETKVKVDGISTDNTMTYNKEAKRFKTITPEELYLRFRDYMINNPQIQLIDFNGVDFSKMNLEEVEIFIEEYLKTFKANWEIVPKGHGKQGEGKKGDPRFIDYDRLNELFMEKQEFYSTLDPFMVIRGKDTFDGYIGYIFSNGTVILDKFYDNSRKGKVSKGDAIYYMDIQDFYKLSQLTKTELMKRKEVGRIIHRGNWQSDVLEALRKTGDGMKVSSQVNGLVNNQLINEESSTGSKK